MTPIDRMTCDEVFSKLDDYLDRELEPAEIGVIREHLTTCAQCAREHTFEATIIALVRQKLRRIELPLDLLRSIREGLGEPERRPSRPVGPTSENEGETT